MPKVKRLKTTAELEELNRLLAANTTARQPVLPYEYHQHVFPAGVPVQRYYGLHWGKKLAAGAVVDPMVIGEATARKQLGENLQNRVYDQWNISWIATALAARGLGYGRAVVEKIIADARRQKIARVKGAADGPVELNLFFQACGFTVTSSPDDPATEDLRRKHPNYHNPRNGSRFFYMDL